MPLRANYLALLLGSFEDAWKTNEALSLEQMRELSSLRRRATNPQGSSLYGNPLVSTADTVEAARLYVEQLALFCNEVGPLPAQKVCNKCYYRNITKK